MTPTDFDFFKDKPVIWFRIKAVPRDQAQVTEINGDGLVAFDVFYPWDYLPGIAEWRELSNSNWEEFTI